MRRRSKSLPITELQERVIANARIARSYQRAIIAANTAMKSSKMHVDRTGNSKGIQRCVRVSVV